MKKRWAACSTKRSDFRSSTATLPPSPSCTRCSPKEGSLRRHYGGGEALGGAGEQLSR